jgi:rhodanese-related sulfurtransferase
MSPPQSQPLLIDVRSPGEFATGALSSVLFPAGAVNIEFMTIDQLPEVYRKLSVDVQKDADITLYCRSGRRSKFALQTLREMGYTRVRDIGGLEEARGVLEREEVERRGLGKEKEKDMERTELGRTNGGAKNPNLERSFGDLLNGLKGME